LLGKTGFFPTDYVEILPEKLQQAPPPPPPPKKKTILQARALYDYEAANPQSMALKKGEVYDVVTKGNPGGWSLGVKGAFPTDYVEFITTEVASNTATAQPAKTNASSDAFSAAKPVSTVASSAETKHESDSSRKSDNPFGDFPSNESKVNNSFPETKTDNASFAFSDFGSTSDNFGSNPFGDTTAAAQGFADFAATTTSNALDSFTSNSFDSFAKTKTDTFDSFANNNNNKSNSEDPFGSQFNFNANNNFNRTHNGNRNAAKPRRRSAFSHVNVPTPTLDGQSFVLTRPGKIDCIAVWRQYVFMDMFADYHISQMVNPLDQLKIPAISRMLVALNLCRTAIAYINPKSLTDNISPLGFSSVNVLGDISGALSEAIDFCERMPVGSNDPNKFHSFLTTFMMRVRQLQRDGILLIPVTWMCSRYAPNDHGILLLLTRVKDEGSDNEFSISVINTSIDEGLCFHGMHCDNGDSSIVFNIAFVLKDIPNVKIFNTAFW
jgi:hypothetical protein